MKKAVFIPCKDGVLKYYLNINDIIYIRRLENNSANIIMTKGIIYDCKDYERILDYIKYRGKDADKCFKELYVFNDKNDLNDYKETFIFIDMNMIHEVVILYNNIIKRTDDLIFYKYIIKCNDGSGKDSYDIEFYQSELYMEENFNRF